MSEDFDKAKSESGVEMPESPEEMEAAIEEAEAELGDHMAELESNLQSINIDELPTEDRESVWAAFRDARDQINTVAGAAMAGGGGLLLLGILQGGIDKSEAALQNLQSFASGGVAAGAVGVAVWAIGHTLNQFKRDKKLSKV